MVEFTMIKKKKAGSRLKGGQNVELPESASTFTSDIKLSAGPKSAHKTQLKLEDELYTK